MSPLSFLQDENDNDEGDEDTNQSVAMETDSVEDQDVGASSLIGASCSSNNNALGERDRAPATGVTKGRKHPFFQRSDSTLCLGCPPPDPFEAPMAQALPLADQPHLLQPNARREELFGMPKQPITVPATGPSPPGSCNPLEVLPTRLGLSVRTADTSAAANVPTPNPSNIAIQLAHSVIASPATTSHQVRDSDIIDLVSSCVVWLSQVSSLFRALDPLPTLLQEQTLQARRTMTPLIMSFVKWSQHVCILIPFTLKISKSFFNPQKNERYPLYFRLHLARG